MTNLLLRTFVRNWDHPEDPQVRASVGIFAGLVGIFCNLLLFGGKLQAYTPEAVTLGENGFCVMV